ncbi:hypothetical protein, partial [uncultured Gammaproteobacteria bacterium]
KLTKLITLNLKLISLKLVVMKNLYLLQSKN